MIVKNFSPYGVFLFSACICLACHTGKTEVRPQPAECFDTNDPESVEWMKTAIREHGPLSIEKYDYLDGWAYYFLSPPRNFLYDCQGALLCEVPGKVMNDCVKKIQSLGKGRVIWSTEVD